MKRSADPTLSQEARGEDHRRLIRSHHGICKRHSESIRRVAIRAQRAYTRSTQIVAELGSNGQGGRSEFTQEDLERLDRALVKSRKQQIHRERIIHRLEDRLRKEYISLKYFHKQYQSIPCYHGYDRFEIPELPDIEVFLHLPATIARPVILTDTDGSDATIPPDSDSSDEPGRHDNGGDPVEFSGKRMR